ncbi:MAG: cytochrome P450 [Bdellovibrionales bacterium]|nr:cytochrome P450 [Bdellovibrionales bacterium]
MGHYENPLLFNDQIKEPYEALADLRAKAPIYYCHQLKGWVITRYRDSTQLFANPKVIAGNLTEQVEAQLDGLELGIVSDYLRIRNEMMLHKDGDAHLRLRKSLNPFFAKNQIVQLSPIVSSALKETISEISDKKEWDFATEFAEPFSTRVIAGLFGVPEADRSAFQKASDDVSRFFGTTMGDIEHDALIANQAILFLENYFYRLVDKKTEEPGNDLISSLLKGRDRSDLTLEEMIAQCILILMAGHFTVIDQLCNSLFVFSRHELIDYLRSHPELLPDAIEESIRLDSGVLFMGRTVKEDFYHENCLFKEEDSLFLGLGACNHDPEAFPNPDTFQLKRRGPRHLGFGFSQHQCLGAELGRLEILEAFTALFKEFPTLNIVDSDVQRKAESLFFRGFYSLPISTV